MERFMRMRPDQLQDAQRHSMAAHDLDALIPTISDAASAAPGGCVFMLIKHMAETLCRKD